MTNDELMHLRRRLKSGEYDGVDIMSVWLALDELVEVRKDAERYRWLRREHASDGPSYHVRRPSNCPAPRDLDADLDAAMKGANNR